MRTNAESINKIYDEKRDVSHTDTSRFLFGDIVTGAAALFIL